MALTPNTIDLNALTQIGREVEGAVEKAEISPSRGRLLSALDNAGAGLETIAQVLSEQIQNPYEDVIRSRAVKTILEVHGLVGANKDRGGAGDINIVVHTQEANVQSNMFVPKRAEID